MMFDLLLLWKKECRGNRARTENLTEFFKFVVKEMRAQEKKFEAEMNAMPTLLKSMKEIPVLKEVFAPMRKKENSKAIQRFFVDSFAVAIALKKKECTSDYANWFLDWTQELYLLWLSPEDRKKFKRT
jgi:hypothetical protein